MLPWIIFSLFIGILLILDLAVFHKEDRDIGFKEAVFWSLFWISLALIFNIGIYLTKGLEPALSFLAGYLVEESLSVDNLFVFLLIFKYFKVPHNLYHRVLFWGIVGALVMRAVFIGAGLYLIENFHWVIYIFGLLLIYGGIRLAVKEELEVHPENNPVLRLLRRFIPITKNYEGNHFFVIRNGVTFATPLFAVLVVIESTDVVFALDSIPAIFAITKDPFIVYTSNIFAILGLRSLFFTLSGLMRLFHHLNYALAFILVFIGCKMLIESIYDVPIIVTLVVIFTSLGTAVITSLLYPKAKI
jgi:tellurite resistance protein TerC